MAFSRSRRGRAGAFLLERSASSSDRPLLEPLAVCGLLAVYLAVNAWHGLDDGYQLSLIPI